MCNPSTWGVETVGLRVRETSLDSINGPLSHKLKEEEEEKFRRRPKKVSVVCLFVCFGIKTDALDLEISEMNMSRD